MGDQELPGVLILGVGGVEGVLENHVGLLKKNFHLITMKEFLENKKELSEKIKSIFIFERRPTIDRGLLESLPNLKVIANSGVGVDHLDLKLISSFGVKVTNTPQAVSDSTADTGMALMLASARRLVEGNLFNSFADVFLPFELVLAFSIFHFVIVHLAEILFRNLFRKKSTEDSAFQVVLLFCFFLLYLVPKPAPAQVTVHEIKASV